MVWEAYRKPPGYAKSSITLPPASMTSRLHSASAVAKLVGPLEVVWMSHFGLWSIRFRWVWELSINVPDSLSLRVPYPHWPRQGY